MLHYISSYKFGMLTSLIFCSIIFKNNRLHFRSNGMKNVVPALILFIFFGRGNVSTGFGRY